MADVVTIPIQRRDVPHNRVATVSRARASGRVADLTRILAEQRAARREETARLPADPLAFSILLVERLIYALPRDRWEDARQQMACVRALCVNGDAQRATDRLLGYLGQVTP